MRINSMYESCLTDPIGFFKLTKHSPHKQRSIVRLGVLLLLFDVYLTWARIEKLALPGSQAPVLSLPRSSIPFQYHFPEPSLTKIYWRNHERDDSECPTSDFPVPFFSGPSHAFNAIIPFTDSASLQCIADIITFSFKKYLRAVISSLSSSHSSKYRASRILLHQALSHTSHYLGIWFTVFGYGCQLGCYCE